MNEKRSKNVLFGAGVAIAVVLGLVMYAVPALAESLSVAGYDSYYGDGSDGKVDILAVTGAKGDTVYINMSRGGEVIASHLAFTLDDESAQADENGDMVGLVNVSFNGGAFSSEETYGIEVFADRAEKQPLYSGEVNTVFAQYGSEGLEPLAVRTLSKDETRAFAPPQTLERYGVAYELTSDKLQDVDGKKAYVYEITTDAPDSIKAHVTYYDVANADGNPIKVEEYTLAKGASPQAVPIESVIASDVDGSFYRTLQLANEVTLSYPGTTEYSIMCKQLSGDWGSVGSFYRATIRYTDTEGASLGLADSVVVNKPYTYTAPTNIYVDDHGTVRAYTLASQEDGVLRLEPGMAEGDAEYSIAYKPISDDAPRTWTVILENGSVAPKDSKRIIDRITYKGTLGETVTHKTSQKIKVDDEDYVPSAAAQETYDHIFAAGDMGVEQVIYYVPDGYVEPEAYDVTVNYVNIATNEVISSDTYTASPSMRADLEITSPESFTANGVDWVRLDGQEEPIRHGFYSKARAYTVYYRDVNDDLHAKTVIRNVRVEYLDDEGNTVTRPTTVVDNGTTDLGPAYEEIIVEDGGGVPSYVSRATGGAGGASGQEGAGGTGGGTGGSGATDTGIATGEDLRAIDGEDGDALVNPEGEELEETRIEDDETPLAGPGQHGSERGVNPVAMGIGIAAAAAIAVGLVLFFVFKRRNKGNDGSSDDDATA